ncbi:hypothetical protein BH11MYX3_BH11MYX3_28230 [soil metagenome]
MITDGVLQLFVRTLGSNKHVKRGAITRFERDDASIPADVARVLDQVGGWRYGDLRFTEPANLETDRAKWNSLVDDFEAGRSSTWNHAFWHRAWIPLATSSVEVYAFDPIGCFGGAPQQIVSFDVKGGAAWHVFPSITAWLGALTDGFEAEGKDALGAAYASARANKTCVDVTLPPTLEEQRSPQRFEAGIGAWKVMRHPDGRSWAIRERRDGYELRIGEGEDAVTRRRTVPSPSTEVRRLIREQKAEGFVSAVEPALSDAARE